MEELKRWAKGLKRPDNSGISCPKPHGERLFVLQLEGQVMINPSPSTRADTNKDQQDSLRTGSNINGAPSFPIQVNIKVETTEGDTFYFLRKFANWDERDIERLIESVVPFSECKVKDNVIHAVFGERVE